MSNDGSEAPERVRILDIQDEMRTSYLTYAMSVIVSRALPDVRDGLKPSQRRILVAMNDLNLGPNSARVKCAKISGDTSGNYHPHGDGSIYPTLVRLAQPWVMREVLIDKQGNFGSLAGLPPAAMRYTEARLSAVASEMMQDINRDTVDYIPTYDGRNTEPVVLPCKVPNLVVNGSNGIAVGMATSIPPHNLGETCGAVIRLIDDPDCGIDELIEELPAPDFPTGGIICGRMGVRQGYMTGRSTLTLRARTHYETEKNSDVIVVTELPYMETRDRIREKLELLVREDKIKGISRVVDLTDRTLPDWKVRLHIVLKRDADKEVVLNQLFQFSPLQTTFSIILLALVGARPQTLTLKEMLQEFLRHRVDVLRRRTEFLLAESRKRKHTVEGMLIAQLNIDEVINTIRNSPSRSEAKDRLQLLEVPGGLIERALGADGYKVFQDERGAADSYSLSPNQAEAIVAMQLGSLAGLERDKLGAEFGSLLGDIGEYLRLLSDEANILSVIRAEMEELRTKYGSKRRTDISDEEIGNYDREQLITEEMMAVTLSHSGYIKRLSLATYKAQNRGGRGIIGTKSDEDDPASQLFVASTHDYLLFFTDKGRVYWQKIYDLPLLSRTSKGRAIVNLLQLGEGEKVTSCVAVRNFGDDRYLMMATRNGTVKKTPLSAFKRPMKGGIIAIGLRDDDVLIQVAIVSPENDVLLATAGGMAIRFPQENARSMGRPAGGVRGISLAKGDYVVGMVVTQAEMDLLTVCENGYGKRTPFGHAEPLPAAEVSDDVLADDGLGELIPGAEELPADESVEEIAAEDDAGSEEMVSEGSPEGEESDTSKSNLSYRRQRRGGKGIRAIRTSDRNGRVVDILAVHADDEVLMVTSRGIIQRVRAREISQIGRNTQGVRIIRLDDGDKLVSLARVASDDIPEELDVAPPVTDVPPETPSESPETSPETE